jgi:hypothetical protein
MSAGKRRQALRRRSIRGERRPVKGRSVGCAVKMVGRGVIYRAMRTAPTIGRVVSGALLLLPAVALGGSFDGAYTGTLSCPAFPGQQPLRAEIAVSVAGRNATYEQGASDLGANEAGSGTVSPSGDIVLTGGCRGGFSCATEYRGNLGSTPIRLKGGQRWWFRSGERERACDLELKPK